MKLIDILVEELPKSGGWPDEMILCGQSGIDNELYFYRHQYNSQRCDMRGIFTNTHRSEDSYQLSIVTRDQYEAALAAKNAPAWNGEGLPPVGCEFEYSHSTNNDGSTHFARATMVASGKQISIIRLPNGNEMWVDNTIGFRPLRTEADRKRDAAISAIFENLGLNIKSDAENVYEAIADGKIPGVKLED